jgi:TolB protein
MMKRLILPACGLILASLAVYASYAAYAAKPGYKSRMVAVDPSGGGDATISPDGEKFIITSKRGGNWDLWVYDLKTARWSQLTNDPAEDFEGKWSPDGKQIAFCSTRAGQRDIWVLTIASGEVKRLTFSEHEDEYPAWSPDGKQIVYTGGPWGARDFFLISPEGGEPRKVSRQPVLSGACAFEAKGASLICHRYDLGTGDIIRLWLDSGEVTPLTVGAAWDYKPNTSPDGRMVAFSRAEEGPSRIFVMTTDGRVRQLTDTPGDDRWPTWSDDGNKMLFHRLVDEGEAVKVLDRKTGAVRILVGADERPLQASFDPEARRVVYCSQTPERKLLKILEVATGTTRVLDTGPGEACYPRWSPDGASIAYAGKSGARWEVSVVKPDGSGRVALTEGVAGLHGMDGPVDWSPDGAKLLFQSDTEPFEARIYTVDVKTRRVEAVTDGAWFDEAPSWTPDGQGFVFMSTRGGNWTWGFFRRALRGGAYTTLAGPDWEQKNYPRQSGSGALIWSATNESGLEVLSERAADGKVRVLEQAGTGARWPSYSRDERLVLFTAVTHRVEYWIAENLDGAGSPLLASDRGADLNEVKERSEAEAPGAVACTARLPAVALWKSPVDLHRR